MGCKHKNTRTETTDEPEGTVVDEICNDCGEDVSTTYTPK